MSETVADVTNAHLHQSPRTAAPHRLDDLAGIQDKVQLDLTPEPRGAEDALASQALPHLYSAYPQDDLFEEELAPPTNRPLSRPVGTTDVFVDDFMQQGQGSNHRLQVLQQHLLHSVNAIPSTPLAGSKRNEAVSLKKLLPHWGRQLGHPQAHPWLDSRHCLANHRTAAPP
jgi:hypothetical protein